MVGWWVGGFRGHDLYGLYGLVVSPWGMQPAELGGGLKLVEGEMNSTECVRGCGGCIEPRVGVEGQPAAGGRCRLLHMAMAAGRVCFGACSVTLWAQFCAYPGDPPGLLTLPGCPPSL
jgi:hypothetical protein